MFLVAFAVFWLLSYGGRACELKGQPSDVVAEVGTNAIFKCPTNIQNDMCTNDNCKVKWYRITNHTHQKGISSCAAVYAEFRDRFSVSRGPNWSLNISRVKLNDARKYRCKISSNTSRAVTSNNVTLIIPSAINITVVANHSQLTEGKSGTFSCLVQKSRGAHFTYKWFLERVDIELFRSSIEFEFGKDKQSVQIRSIGSQQNGSNLTCAAYSGDTLVKTSENFMIRVRDRLITAQPIVPEIPTINPGLITTNRDSVVPGASTKDYRSRAPPAVTVEGDSGIDHSGSGNTALFAGGGVGVVFLILLIVCLIYFLVFKGRNKTRSQRPKPRDGDRRDAGAVELAETQPTKHAASESDKASTSSTREEGAVEPHPLDSQTQVCEDTPPFAEKPTPFDCGYKPRLLDPVYALVDKSHPQIAAGQSSKVSQKDEPKGGVITVNEAGRDEIQPVQWDTIPGEKVAPVAGSKPGRTPTGQKPPSVTPYHLSKSQKHTRTEAKSEPPEQTADRGGDGTAQGDPRLRNAEGLIYADLDLSRASPRIVSSEEEETLYAGIVNRETVGNLREGSIRHAP